LLTPNIGGADKPSRADLRGVRVLIVEDNWHVAHALRLLLETEGMEVSGTAATLNQAFRLATEQKPDVAVVDINLRGELAYGLIDQMHDQRVRIIVLTGYAVLAPRLTGEVDAVLQKPFNGPELLDALRRTLSP
jgi:DNA-binding response OmpR family regulator